MKGLDTGKDKVKKICDILRKETLEPAKHEADDLIHRAEKEAERIVRDANHAADKLIAEARDKMERERTVFQASLNQACRQTIESLKQEIEEKLFNKELSRIFTKQMQDVKTVAHLVTAVVHAIEKEGMKGDLSVIIPAAVSAQEVNEMLALEIREKLREKSVLVGPISGGIEVKLHRDHITVDLTDTALVELVSRYIRKDFRSMLFGAG
jgi:V/A-type H+-transporting ATPase subunit E